MRESALTRTFEALPIELFERSTEDDSFEAKLLTLTKKSNVDVSEWTKQDTHVTRVISYTIPASLSANLALLSKGSDVSVSKFQDVVFNSEKTEFILDYKLFYAQTQAIGNIHIVFQLLEPVMTQCTISIKNSCKNVLLKDKIENVMEEESMKEMNLWLDMLWERHMAHKALETHKPPILDLEPVLVVATPATSPNVHSSRQLASKAFARSTHDLQELGELEEIKVLSGGLSNLSSELDLLRRTVESHYVRLCSLEAHLTSQSQAFRASSSTDHNSTQAHNTPANFAETSTSVTGTSTSSSALNPPPHTSHMAFNSVEELEARQRVLRSQLTAQMQNIEKSILKQQQASQQIKTLESRWETMIDSMGRHLQDIDTLRYGLLGTWKFSLSVFCFIIIWPLIVRYLWKSYGKKWVFTLIHKYWQTNKKTIAAPSSSSTVATSISLPSTTPLTSILSTAFNAVMNRTAK